MNPFIGISLQLAATLAFTIMGALVRYLGERVPLGEVVFARSFLALIPLLVMLVWRGELADAVRTQNLFGHVMRSFTNVAAMFGNYAGLARIPLADATAIGFATPLFSVVLAALVLGEVVRVWRWSAVVVGLVGVLVMLSPHLGHAPRDEASALGAMFSLGGAFFLAVAITQVRHLAATETTASLVFFYSTLSSLVGLATLYWGWVLPSPGDLAALIAIGIFGGIGQILITESYRHASASVVAPFAYVSMLWSVAFGYVLFAEVPAPVVLIGAGIVIASGLFVIFRERRLGIERATERRAEGSPGGPAV
jgi:drug/metabolite transporter (DMT)-like permease